MELASGTIISHYRIQRKLGGGGMGVVFEAEDLTLHRKVALKFLLNHLSGNPQALERFQREARAASSLNHPNICTIHEIGEFENCPFIVMELMRGQTLKYVIGGKPMEIEQIVEFGIQISDALAAAHAQKIIHRDIKPANIFITEAGHSKLLDFGIAKNSASLMPTDEQSTESVDLTKTGAVIGTLSYMSPEQARGKELDSRSDIFSFGTVLYEMTTGTLPFQGSNNVEILEAILTKQPLSVKNKNPNAPIQLQHIISKALEKDRDIRYQSVTEIKADLKGFKHEMDSSHISAITTSRRQFIVSYPLLLSILVIIMLGIGIAFYRYNVRHSAIHSIAVLPFLNANANPENEYLSDGITESIINGLSQVPQLQVMARGTVFTYKGKYLDPRKVGRDLNVEAVVTGSILQKGETLVVQADLVRVKDGIQLWGNRYDREFVSILSLQSDISKEISEQLRFKLTGEQKKRVEKHYTESVEAYQLYLKGRYFWNKRTEDGLRQAIDYFKDAIIKDPSYALAYVGLSDCYQILSWWGFAEPTESYTQAKIASEKALQLDSTLAEAHTSLAGILDGYEWKFANADREYKKAIELNPNYSIAHEWYAFNLSKRGKHQEAISEIKKARDLDPLNQAINASVGNISVFAGRYDDAIRELHKAIALYPDYPDNYWELAEALIYKKMFTEALAASQKAGTISQDKDGKLQLARIYASMGKSEETNKILKDIMQLTDNSRLLCYSTAKVYAALGHKEEAFSWLEKAYANRDDRLPMIKVDPGMENLRSDQRFMELVTRVGLP